MAKTLSAKNRKSRRDKATAYKKGTVGKAHKKSVFSSRKAKKKKAFPMA
jgi:hypothetical protein